MARLPELQAGRDYAGTVPCVRCGAGKADVGSTAFRLLSPPIWTRSICTIISALTPCPSRMVASTILSKELKRLRDTSDRLCRGMVYQWWSIPQSPIPGVAGRTGWGNPPGTTSTGADVKAIDCNASGKQVVQHLRKMGYIVDTRGAKSENPLATVSVFYPAGYIKS